MSSMNFQLIDSFSWSESILSPRPAQSISDILFLYLNPRLDADKADGTFFFYIDRVLEVHRGWET